MRDNAWGMQIDTAFEVLEQAIAALTIPESNLPYDAAEALAAIRAELHRVSYDDGVRMMAAAADRAGRRRLVTDEATHSVPVTLFLYSKIEAASLLEALDIVELDERQRTMRDELQGFVSS